MSDYKLSLWYNYFLEVPVITPDMVRDAFYWTVSIVLLSESFVGWSYKTSPYGSQDGVSQISRRLLVKEERYSVWE